MSNQKGNDQINQNNNNLENEFSQLTQINDNSVSEDKLKDLYLYYKSIVNENELKSFIYRNLLVDVIAFFLFELELLDNFIMIDNLYLGLLYLVKYLATAFNGILYIYYILYANKENELASNNIEYKMRNIRTNFTIRKFFEDSYKAGENIKENNIHIIQLSKTHMILKFLLTIKIFNWFVKYIAYSLYMILDPILNPINFTSLLVLLIDYYLLGILKFYYLLLLRTEYILNYLKNKNN